MIPPNMSNIDKVIRCEKTALRSVRFDKLIRSEKTASRSVRIVQTISVRIQSDNCILLPEQRVSGLTILTVCTDRKRTFRFVYRCNLRTEKCLYGLYKPYGS